MKTLIIGGEGFIGQNLTNCLRQRGDAVEWSHGSILEHIPRGKWEHVFYLAGLPEPNTWGKYAVDVLRVSSEGLQNAIKIALDSGCPLLSVSSSAIYGKAPVPMSEKSTSYLEVWSPRERYAIGKAYGEALCMAYSEKLGLEYRIVRPFNVYGPRFRKDDTRVISNFARRGLAGQNLQVTGDGSQFRCFCYIDDFISGLLKLMEAPSKTVVNIGNPEKITIKEIAEIVAKLTNVGIEYIPRVEGDITERIPDISLISSFGWSPMVRFNEGIKRTIEWAKKNW